MWTKFIQLFNRHNLTNYWQPCFFFRLFHQFNSFHSQSLESIWRCSWFNYSTSQHCCSCSLHRFCRINNLFLILYRTRSSHHNQIISTNFYISYFYNCILWMKFSTRSFIWLLNPLNIRYTIYRQYSIRINYTSISNNTYNRILLTIRKMQFQFIIIFQSFNYSF